MAAATKTVISTLVVEDGALVWRVSGTRGASPNKRDGAHWREARRDRDKWKTLFFIANGFPESRADWNNPTRAHITIREWGLPPRDLDNAVAANKWLIDAIVAAGFLADDSPKVLVGLSIEQPAERPDWIIGNGRTPAVEIILRGE